MRNNERIRVRGRWIEIVFGSPSQKVNRFVIIRIEKTSVHYSKE